MDPAPQKRHYEQVEGILPPIGEACLACRKVKVSNYKAVKRKCINSATSGVHSQCDRCRALELECIFRQKKRGRKSLAELNEMERTSPRATSSRPSSPGQSPERPVSTPGHSMQTPRYTPRAPQIPLSQMRHTPVDPPTVLPEVAVPPRAGNYSLERILDNGPLRGNAQRVAKGSFAEAFPSSPGASSSARNTVADMQMDPVQSRILAEEEVQPLFDFFFEKLNPLISLLDPKLHTPTYCRTHSIHLFTAILTVACKVIRPKAYHQCLAVANLFISHAFMQGLSSVELVQSLVVLAVWRESDDNNQWRRIGYAIRCALELRLHKPHPRPLPDNPSAARQAVNRERTWIYLTIADHHYAVQQTLPRMISADYVGDPMLWLEDHPTVDCPVETSLAGSLLSLRMQELYEALILDGGKPNSRLLIWLRKYLGNWRANWVDDGTRKKLLMPEQVAFMKFCGNVFQFQLDEFELYLATLKKNEQSAKANLAFGSCMDSSRATLDSLTADLAPLGFLPYALDAVWVSLSTTAVWLAQNIAYMSLEEGQAAYESLSVACSTCQAASQGANDMPAYAGRLLAHLTQRVRNAPPPSKPTEQPRTTPNSQGGFETLLELQAQLNQNAPTPTSSTPANLADGVGTFIPSADDNFWQAYYPALSEFGQQSTDTFWNNAPLSIGGLATSGSNAASAVDWTVFGQNLPSH